MSLLQLKDIENMDSLSELMKSLNVYFKWNKARLFCLAGMLLALISVRTVNLREVAVAFASDALLDSRYKRLKRFFTLFTMDYSAITRWIFGLYFSSSEKIYLTIDRTNWYWGKSKINVLTLGAAHEGMAIPLIWRALNKAGNALASEHIEIIQRFVKIIGNHCIEGVLADREFGSHELFHWCNKNKIPFYIRIKDNALVHVPKCKGKGRHVKKLFGALNPNQQYAYPYAVELYGVKVYVAGSRSETGEWMVVATNQAPKNAISIYLRRWEIETLFSCLKERGFNFEDTRITQLERIEKLMGVLAMATAWVHKIGEWRATIKPIKLRRYKDGQMRPQFSYFRYGLDFIRESILQIRSRFDQFMGCLVQMEHKKWSNNNVL